MASRLSNVERDMLIAGLQWEWSRHKVELDVRNSPEFWEALSTIAVDYMISHTGERIIKP